MTEFSLSSADRSRLSERRRELLREQRRLNLRRFFRNGHAVAGALIILAMVLLAVFAPLLAPADPLAQTVANRFAKPGTEGYLLGADKLGRDLLSRIIYGARVSMIVGVSSSLCSMLFGMIIGLYACSTRTTGSPAGTGFIRPRSFPTAGRNDFRLYRKPQSL